MITYSRAVPCMVSVIETESTHLLWKNLSVFSLGHSKLIWRHINPTDSFDKINNSSHRFSFNGSLNCRKKMLYSSYTHKWLGSGEILRHF